MLVTNNSFIPTITHIAGTGSMATGDNVVLDKTYKFIYTLEGNNKPFVYKTTGKQMLRSFSIWANQIAEIDNTSDLNEIRITLTTYISLFVTRQISKAEYRNIVKDYPADAIQLVKNAVKDKSFLQRAHEFIEAYMYLKHINEDISNTVLHVVDSKPDKYTDSEILKNWQESPLAKRGGIKTREEFLEVWSTGSLVTDWTTEQ